MARRNQEFQAIRSEGGLLPADLLRRILDRSSNLAGTRPEDYGLPAGERLNELITQSWNRLRKHWAEFREAAVNLPETEAGTGLTNDRWNLPLLRELGFGLLPTSAGPEIGGRTYAISRFFGPVPVHLIGCNLSLDRRAAGQRGAAAANPHGLVQEFLNRSDAHLWALLSNGLRLRILRDNQALSRQSFLEFDLEAMMSGEVYSDFVLLWLVAHATRFAPREGDRPETCWLEQWTQEAEEQGTRALGELRRGVEQALAILGEGFTSHPKNAALRDALRSSALSPTDLHAQLLRLVYRLIFLFVAEDRSLEGQPLIHPLDRSDAARAARERYAAHYGTGRLREMAGKIKGSRHGDLWRQFQILVRALSGDPESDTIRRALALPALGSFLWDPISTPDLNDAELTNFDLLEALRHLAFTRQGKVLRPVDYKNLGAEELGGVYESLLALTPQVSGDGARFTFAEFAGNERKTSGSYYTPDSLVQCLLDSALDPVVEEAIKGKPPEEAEEAILALNVCDPAVGSGHFLVGAGHRLARHLARVRALAEGESEPSPLLYQHALRDVIGRCLYGVDVNPMAAELCRVSLWLEALEPGKPLSFLDHHIRVGNSLLGTTPELIAGGLPDEAFKPMEGDDKKVCAALKKRNKQERDGRQMDLGLLMVAEANVEYDSLASRSLNVNQTPDDSLEGVEIKAQQFRRLEVSPEYRHQQLIADAWCASFVWPKRADAPEAITTDTINRLRTDGDGLSLEQGSELERLAREYQFFHWNLAFPDVFLRGGFDCILGNPPWVRQELLGEMKRLLTTTPSYSGTADLSLFFLSLAIRVVKAKGRVGLLTPNKWIQAAYGRKLRGEVLKSTRVVLLVDFGHSRELFPGIDTFPVAIILEGGIEHQGSLRFVRAHDDDRRNNSLATLVAGSGISVLPESLTEDRWQLQPAEISNLVNRLLSSGRQLRHVVNGHVYRGVLTGLNEAFIITKSQREHILAECPDAERLIKPWLTGADVKRWQVQWSGAYLIFTKRGIDISRYPAVERHLQQFRVALAPKSSTAEKGPGRKPGNYKWYEIQDNVAFSDLLDLPKIVVPCIAYYCEFAMENRGYWPNNKVILVASDDPCLLGVLNSRTMWWLMNRLMIKMKDDALSVDAHILARLPIPQLSEASARNVTEIVQELTRLSGAMEAIETRIELELALNEAVDSAFGLSDEEKAVIENSLPPRDPLTVEQDKLAAQSL